MALETIMSWFPTPVTQFPQIENWRCPQGLSTSDLQISWSSQKVVLWFFFLITHIFFSIGAPQKCVLNSILYSSTFVSLARSVSTQFISPSLGGLLDNWGSLSLIPQASPEGWSQDLLLPVPTPGKPSSVLAFTITGSLSTRILFGWGHRF